MRIEGRIKMGYYPTPEVVVEQIKKALVFPEDQIAVLDPCCGEGLAVAQLALDENTKTYGVELDQARAKEAEGRLNHIISGSYKKTRITKHGFSLLWLNPPYDYEEGERLEKRFLQDTADYLRPGGILVFILPQKRLDKRIARFLSSRFQDIHLWRFPDTEFAAFGQMVLIGVRRKNISVGKILPTLQDVPEQELPVLCNENEEIYTVPTSKGISLFRSTEIDPEELQQEIAASPLWDRIKDKNGICEVDKPTPLPLGKGHIAMLLASGRLNGLQGEGEDQHLVRGKVVKTFTTVSQATDENGVEETIVRESFRVQIKLMDKKGDIRLLA